MIERFRPPYLALALMLGALAGCGEGANQQATYSASGQVLMDGKPVVGAVVVFHPVDAAKFKWDERPQGRTDAEGRFKLFTYKEGDGAPAGEYRVAVALVPTGDEDGGDQVRRAKGQVPVPAKYGTKEQSGLSATVGTSATALEPFQLTAAK